MTSVPEPGWRSQGERSDRAERYRRAMSATVEDPPLTRDQRLHTEYAAMHLRGRIDYIQRVGDKGAADSDVSSVLSSLDDLRAELAKIDALLAR